MARDAHVTGVFFGLPSPLLGLGMDVDENNRPLVTLVKGLRKVELMARGSSVGVGGALGNAEVENGDVVGRARRRVWRMSIILNGVRVRSRALFSGGWTVSLLARCWFGPAEQPAPHHSQICGTI